MTTFNHRAVALTTALFAAALLTTALSCRTSGGSGGGWLSFRYQKCSEKAPCPAGFGCESGHCVSDDGRFVMTTARCETGEQCGFGMACVESACVVDMLDCVSDFDCVGDQVCLDGTCVEEEPCIRSMREPCSDSRLSE